MTTLSQDPKGYYAVLGLAPGADLRAIKAAYRARVKSVHPDRNAAGGAGDEFQRLVEAYRVLMGSFDRGEYEAAEAPAVDEDAEEAPAAPFSCTGCGKITAQPRYVAFHWVKSFLLWSRRGRTEGIFCRDCADSAAARASVTTWIRGWWSLPGLVLAPSALVRNLLGGSKPRDHNARLLIRQARAFLDRGQPEIARAQIEQAALFARTSVHRRQVQDLRVAIGGEARRLKDRWKPFQGGAFMAQILPLVALPLVLALFVVIAWRPWERPVAAAAGIVVQRASVGEIRHVALDELKLRQAPVEGSPVLALLDRFTSVQVLDAPELSEWTQVQTPAGVSGWVPIRALYAGSGALFKRDWCAANPGVLPQAGEVLVRRASGEHRLLIHNDGRNDAVVKLKTSTGNTVASYFVPATFHIGVAGIPDGTYRIEFSSGKQYSRACGVFVAEAQAGLMPFTLTFKQYSAGKTKAMAAMPEIALVAAPGDAKQPQPLDLDKFAADD